MDTVRVSGIRLFPDPANKTMQDQVAKIYDVPEPEAVGNPFFPMLVGMIFFLVSILVYPSTYFRHRPSLITYSRVRGEGTFAIMHPSENNRES